MNNKRRKQIAELTVMLETITKLFEQLKDEEEDAYYNMPESLQESERGERMQCTLDNMEDVYSYLDEACDLLKSLED